MLVMFRQPGEAIVLGEKLSPRVIRIKENQTLEIGERITFDVVEVRDSKVRLGTEIPPEMSIRRGEVA